MTKPRLPRQPQPQRQDRPLALAAYASWAAVAVYVILRFNAVQHALGSGPEALVGAIRFVAVLGVPLAVIGAALAVLAFARAEPRLWVAVGAFAVCGVILVISYLELSGKLVGVLADKLPGVEAAPP